MKDCISKATAVSVQQLPGIYRSPDNTKCPNYMALVHAHTEPPLRSFSLVAGAKVQQDFHVTAITERAL